MRARLFTALCSVCTAWCLSILALWTWSDTAPGVLTKRLATGWYALGASGGEIGLTIYLHYDDLGAGDVRPIEEAPPQWRPTSSFKELMPVANWAGFGSFHRHRIHRGDGFIRVLDIRRICAPLWPFAIAVAVIPALWLRGWLLRRRARPGRGFDIRARGCETGQIRGNVNSRRSAVV